MENQLATRTPPESTALQINLDQVAGGLAKIKSFQALVRKSLVPDHDYGVIPGTPKPSLWKPGAEKLCKLLSLSDSYIVADKVEDWDRGFFSYQVTCELRNISDGKLIAQGLGSCNSREARYRYRWVFGSEVPHHIDKASLAVKSIRTRKGQKATMYRVENDDPYSLVNTLLKMAKKRAMVDAVLSAGRLSDIFSQGGEPPDASDDEMITLPRRREQMFQYFSSQGVAKQRVLDLLGVTRCEEIGLEGLHRLRDIATQIANGAISVDDVFGQCVDEGPATDEIPAPESESRETEESDFDTGPEQGDPTLAERKSNLIEKITTALDQLHGDEQAARLTTLKNIFGRTILTDIVKLPKAIIEAGLGIIEQQVRDAEAD